MLLGGTSVRETIICCRNGNPGQQKGHPEKHTPFYLGFLLQPMFVPGSAQGSARAPLRATRKL